MACRILGRSRGRMGCGLCEPLVWAPLARGGVGIAGRAIGGGSGVGDEPAGKVSSGMASMRLPFHPKTLYSSVSPLVGVLQWSLGQWPLTLSLVSLYSRKK